MYHLWVLVINFYMIYYPRVLYMHNKGLYSIYMCYHSGAIDHCQLLPHILNILYGYSVSHSLSDPAFYTR